MVEAARDLTGAEYAALGVLDRDGTELERFIYLGIDEETRQTIGALPRGRGVLGELIRHPEPLRIRDVEEHRHAYGFPPGHPPMHTFLGVPIRIQGEVYGNLYMTEKRGGVEFDESDEAAATTLASYAGIAIENARVYTCLREREEEEAKALRRAQTSADIARLTAGETDVERVRDLIVKRARALVDAQAAVILVRCDETIEVAARAGAGRELDILTARLEDAFRTAVEERIALNLRAGSAPSDAPPRDRTGAEAALVVPLEFRGSAVGALVTLEPEADGNDFDDEQMQLLRAFAGSAAIAIGTAQTVHADGLQRQAEAADRERQRWSHELRDGALRELAAIRISLTEALRAMGERRAEPLSRAAEVAVERLERQITELSRIINDLSPAPAEHSGLGGATESPGEEPGPGRSALSGGSLAEANVPLGFASGRPSGARAI